MSKTKIKEKGRLVVISGPSGVGKGTVLTELFSLSDEYVSSISATTRKKREHETDGVSYFFKTKEQFEDMIEKGELLEYATYNGQLYGTPEEYVNKMLDEGKNVILEIDVQGALQVKQLRSDAIMIFIAPESKDVLYSRLVGRGTETEDIIEKRIEIAERELRACLMYDYITLNKDGEAKECAKDILAAVRVEKIKSGAMFSKVLDYIR